MRSERAKTNEIASKKVSRNSSPIILYDLPLFFNWEVIKSSMGMGAGLDAAGCCFARDMKIS
jgi:hypothetical protein